jgi:GNAT superfamily N-acetyltransferase
MVSSEVRIRPALHGDRSFVLAAAQRLASFDPPAWRPAREIVEGERRTLQAFFEAPPEGSSLLLAESEKGEGLGFVYLERLHDYFTLEAHGHIGILVVTETAAGKGVGSALMRAAEAWAREQGYRKLTLTVFERNRGARAVYDHLGYAPETLRYVKIL